MKKLNQLIQKIEGELSIKVSPHKDKYLTVSEYVLEFGHYTNGKIINAIGENVFAKMLEMDEVIHIRFSPNNKGYYTILHYDLEQAIEQALCTLENKPFSPVNQMLVGNYLLLDLINDDGAKKAAKCYAMSIKDFNPELSIKILKKIK